MSTSFSDSSSETSVSEARQEDTPRIHLLHETWRSERQYEMDYMTLHFQGFELVEVDEIPDARFIVVDIDSSLLPFRLHVPADDHPLDPNSPTEIVYTHAKKIRIEGNGQSITPEGPRLVQRDWLVAQEGDLRDLEPPQDWFYVNEYQERIPSPSSSPEPVTETPEAATSPHPNPEPTIIPSSTLTPPPAIEETFVIGGKACTAAEQDFFRALIQRFDSWDSEAERMVKEMGFAKAREVWMTTMPMERGWPNAKRFWRKFHPEIKTKSRSLASIEEAAKRRSGRQTGRAEN